MIPHMKAFDLFIEMKQFFYLTSDSLTTISVEQNGCPSYQLILLTQGPICEILAKIAQLLGVVEKLSFFVSEILIFFASSLFKSVTIYVIPRMERNLDDYPDFQQKAQK